MAIYAIGLINIKVDNIDERNLVLLSLSFWLKTTWKLLNKIWLIYEERWAGAEVAIDLLCLKLLRFLPLVNDLNALL